MKFKNLIFIMVSAMTLMACDGNKGSSPGNPGGPTAESDTVAAFKYFKGDFAASSDGLNWSEDMTIHFDTTGYHITAKHPDADCKKTGKFTSAQTTELFNLVSALTVMQADDKSPKAPNDGVEYIELTLSSGEKRKYYLQNLNVPEGELYATNGTEVSDYLQDLEDSLATLCASDIE